MLEDNTESPDGPEGIQRPPSSPSAPEAPKRRRKPRGMGATGLSLILGGLFLLGILAFAGFVVLVTLASASGAGVLGYEPLVEEYVRHGDGGSDEKVAIVSVAGVIDGQGSFAEGGGLCHLVAQQLRQAAEDEAVKAVILQVDSPGGGLAASDILYEEVKRLKRQGKVVVVLVGTLAASGGYYVAAPADWIVAGPTSLIGSFGVIMPHFVFKELIDEIGVKYDPVKTGTMKDIGSPFRDMTAEEREELQAMLADAHGRFVSIIAENRSMDPETVKRLANGTIYRSADALDYGLIDEIGYMDEALACTIRLAGLSEDPSLVVYRTRGSLLESMVFGSKASVDTDLQQLKAVADALRTQAPQALWMAPRLDAR